MQITRSIILSAKAEAAYRCLLKGYRISGLHQFSVDDDTTTATSTDNVASDHAYGSNISSVVEFTFDGRDFILTGSASGGVILLERTLSGDIGVIDGLGAVEGLGVGAIIDVGIDRLELTGFDGISSRQSALDQFYTKPNGHVEFSLEGTTIE